MNKIKQVIRTAFCIYFGHSNILEVCFGYVSCSRCGEQIGDTIAGAYSNDKAVILGHSCETCKENYKKLTWRDKFLAPSKKEIFK